jgi:thymidylate synthase
MSNLKRNPKSRKALCNINQPKHKDPKSRDFPCTIAVQFLVRGGRLCCEVFSRSEDVVMGLPYDIGFFSFMSELVCADLNRYMKIPVELGYTMVRCSFTQIYDRTAPKAELTLEKSLNKAASVIRMPAIEDPGRTLEDIYCGTRETEVMRWIFDKAQLAINSDN